MADPSLETCPDFAGDIYAGIRNDLTAATGDQPQEVIDRLVAAWTEGHNARVLEWNQRREEEAREEAEIERARAAQEEEDRLAREAEAERERLESEKKKPKMNGFSATAAVGDAIVPRPSQFAIQKLNNFEYIELWYFSPEGCKDALKTSRTPLAEPSATQHYRRSSYREPYEPRRRASRSRSPGRAGNPRRADRSPSPDKGKNREQRAKGFSRGAGSRGRSACAICLGRFSHDIQRCDSRNLWDKTTPAHARRSQDGRIISTNGLPLCYRWQRPGGCLAENHDSAHACSGCGDKSHGAQTCPRGEKA
ncbi:hypothetical protein P692DRAFT_201798413 [Suillus brevipes Sb2]|nr:hypothetical protein P692DRAFT_201798413 [Suillus brevipes Sb2]